MTDAYNLKSVFSCSDLLSDFWQGGPDDAVPLDGLACPSEGGSTQLGRGKSADLLHLLGQPEEADSNMRTLQNLAASSSTKQESSGGQAHTGEPVDSSLLHSALSISQSMLSEPLLSQHTSTSFPHFERQASQLQPIPSTSSGQGVFHMDPVKQAKAICNHGVSLTALQQQLAEMKSKTTGLESFIRSGLQSEALPCFPEAASAKQSSPSTAGTLEGLPPQIPPADPTPAPQPQLGLQEYQLRQLASLLGSANMAALQNMTLPGPAPSMPGTSGRDISQQPSISARGHDHSSGDDDTGAIPELHKLTGLEDSLGDDHEHEHAWEAKLDKSLPPPEMKRMRRMLSNRESARRSRRRKQAHMQDLEVQNNELVEANEKLQKELSMLRNLAKEAILEKKKSQSALESLKHQVVHAMLPKQDPNHRDQAQPASTGTDSDASGSGHLAVKVPVNTAGAMTSPQASHSPVGMNGNSRPATAQEPARSPKAAVSPRSGAKRKSLEVH